MKKSILKNSLLMALAAPFILTTAYAAPIIYPAKGQSATLQQKDDGECYGWAKKTTGIDPTTMTSTPAPTSTSTVGGGERVHGAARGALGGAAIGAIAGDAGKGAAIGATAGTMAGGARARQKQAHAQQASAQSQAQNASALETYNRAYGACMEGRGYTLK
jgi:hypothetical protein